MINNFVIGDLQNPQQGLDNVAHALKKRVDFLGYFESLQLGGAQKVGEILGEDTYIHIENDITNNLHRNDPRIALLSTQKRDNFTLKRHGIKENGIQPKKHPNEATKSSLLQTYIQGFEFAHGFTCSNNINNKVLINTVWFDFGAINQTQNILGKENFYALEKALGKLFFYMNHDYTMHHLGLNTKSNNTCNLVDRVLLDNIDMKQLSLGVKNDTTEICASLFHKNILKSLNTQGVPIYNDIINSTEIVCMYIDQIQDNGLRNYWNSLLKYSLFTIVSKDNPSIASLRNTYSNLDFTPSRWGEANQANSIITKDSQEIGIDELREAVIQDLNNNMTIYTSQLLTKK